MSKWKKQLDKGVSYLKRNGLKRTCKRAMRKLLLIQDMDYEKWLKAHRPDEERLNLQRRDNMGDKPVVLIRMVSDDSLQNEKTQKSVSEQTYGFLAIGQNMEYADYILLVRNGVILAEDAVYEMVKAAQEYPETELFYTDDDVIRDQKYCDPFFKPEFDECLMLQWEYLGDVLFLKKELAGKVHDMADFSEIAEKAQGIKRIPKILAHTDGVYRNKRKLVDRMLSIQPKISVIIPNKDHYEDLEKCIESVISLGGYENLEILIMENNSEDENTFQSYEKLKEEYPFLRIITWEDGFNYAAINNYAAHEAEGEYLLFLNNDTIVKSDGFIMELMKWGSLKKCGAIGAQLLYQDLTLQHGGVVIGYGGVAGHAFEGMPQKKYEETIYAQVVRQMSAVTAACMLVKKEAFFAVGGFEEQLRVAYNDIDLCMKLRAEGWMVLYDPFAEMYHLESQTRGLEMSAEKARRVSEEAAFFCERWKKELDAGDCFYNPNLTLEKSDFSLRR